MAGKGWHWQAVWTIARCSRGMNSRPPGRDLALRIGLIGDTDDPCRAWGATFPVFDGSRAAIPV
jgi:hypothetical protein